MFWGFPEANKKVCSMEKNNLRTMTNNPLTRWREGGGGWLRSKIQWFFFKAFLINLLLLEASCQDCCAANSDRYRVYQQVYERRLSILHCILQIDIAYTLNFIYIWKYPSMLCQTFSYQGSFICHDFTLFKKYHHNLC